MHIVPRKQQLHDSADDMLRLPPSGLRRSHQSKSRSRGLPNRLHSVPQHRQLDGGDLQSQQHGLPSNRRPCERSMCIVSREQQFHDFANGVLRLPPDRLQRDHQSKSRSGSLPHRLHSVPQHQQLDGGDLQSQQHGLPSNRRACECSVLIVPRQQQLHDFVYGLLRLPPG